MLSYLTRLSRLSVRRDPSTSEILEACAVVREAMGAQDAYVIRAGDPYFTRIGDDEDPDRYEIKQRGYWLVWQQMASDESLVGAAFTVSERLVTEGGALQATTGASHVSCILPADESNSEMLVLRGPWPEGIGQERADFLEAARPIVAALVARVLDARRQSRQQEQLRALADVARAFSEASVVDNVLQAVATAMAKASGFDWVQIIIVNEDCSRVVDGALNVARHSQTETAAMSLQESQRLLEVAAELNRRREPILRPDVFHEAAGLSQNWRTFYERAHILSNALFPVVFQEQLLGYVVFSSSRRRIFEGSEVQFLNDLASQAATTIKGLRLYQEIEEASRIQHFVARTDMLTGIPNRRYIEEVLQAECARAQRYSEPVALVMADLDYFKRINDTYGHATGDEALKHVAEVARESCRKSDFVGRWGGDEFLFILPVTPLEGGVDFADRFRTSVSESAFVPMGGAGIWTMTLSAGVAEASAALYPRPDSLFQMADAALYRAKDSGRNRVLPASFRAAAA